jgi:hypothetical protein
MQFPGSMMYWKDMAMAVERNSAALQRSGHSDMDLIKPRFGDTDPLRDN